MRTEKLLKEINDLLKKHEHFLNSNPEIFFAIEERLLKAIDDEDEDQPEGDENYVDEDDYYNQAGGYGDDLFDDAENEEYEDEDAEYVNSGNDDEDSDAEAWLKENDPSYVEREEPAASPKDEDDQYAGGHEDEEPELDLDEGAFKKPEAKKDSAKEEKKSSVMREWKPRDQYESHHEAKMKEYMNQGYSHREAERLAGAHQAPNSFYDALKSGVHPSDPSPKMLEQMRGLAHNWLRDAERKISERAEADVNPQKYASAKTLAAHDAAHKDFASAYDSFLNSDEVKGLSGRQRHQAIQAWKNKWHEENPEHKDAAKQAASSGSALKEAFDARKQRLQEGEASLLTAGFSSGEDNQMAGEFSSGAAGETPETRGMQAAAQSVGGEQDDDSGGYSANIQKDPNQVFHEKNKAYVDHLRNKLSTKLQPEQMQRMSAVNSFKKKGDQ